MTNTANEAVELQLLGGVIAIGAQRLVDDVSINLSARSVTGLIGPNGAGKSTLARALARQQPLTSGACAIGGRPYAALSSREFSRRIAYLPQAIPPTNGLTVAELVRMGRYPWHGALGRFTPADGAAVDEALAITGTDVFADRLTDTLSGGERQRCWIAMLLAQQASVLILDEPVSALDMKHQLETLNLLHRISRLRGVSVLVILHDVNLAARYCDQVVALKAGRVAWQGSAPDLIDAAILEVIYDTPMAIVKAPDTGEAYAFAQSPTQLPD